MSTDTDRFKLTMNPMSHPFTCVVCRVGVETRPLIDTGTEMEIEGTIYLCTACVTEAASVIDLYPFDVVEKKIKEASTKIAGVVCDRVASLFDDVFTATTGGAVSDFFDSAVKEIRQSLGSAPDNSGKQGSPGVSGDSVDAKSGADSGVRTKSKSAGPTFEDLLGNGDD